MTSKKKLFTNFESILKIDDLPTEEVYVKEWGGAVLVRSLTGAERDQFESESVERKGKSYEANMKNLRARLVALTVVNEAGERVFSDKHIDALGQKNAAALDTIFVSARRLSGFSTEDVEDLVKN